MGHLSALTVFSAIVSLVFSLLTKEDNRERVRYFVKLFAAFFFLSILAAWVMYLFPF
jgi:membrane-anchored protein YejM (alkaline phosphatase superfamily)